MKFWTISNNYSQFNNSLKDLRVVINTPHLFPLTWQTRERKNNQQLLFSLQIVTHSSHQRIAQKRLVGFSVNNFPQEQQTYNLYWLMSLTFSMSWLVAFNRWPQSMVSLDVLNRCSSAVRGGLDEATSLWVKLNLKDLMIDLRCQFVT